VQESPFITGENPYQNRVDRSIAFIDLSGFTHYTDAEGDGAAVEVLVKFRAAVREVCALKGVRIAKWLGDGAMLIGVEPEQLAEALGDLSRLLQDARLPLRAGAARGQVILFEGDDYIGSSVNLAARLCDTAKPGQVLAPSDFPSSLMVNTRAKELGDIVLKGFDHPVAVVEIEAR